MRVAARIGLIVIGVIVYSLMYMPFIRQEKKSNENRLQRPEVLEALRRLKRIEDKVDKIGEFTYTHTHTSLNVHIIQ